MSVEQDLKSIAESLRQIASALTKEIPDAPQAVPVPPPPPAVTVPVPAVAPAPQPAPAPAAFPMPPAVPTPPPAPAVSQPFADEKAVMAYVMEKYKTLGPVKGGMIQQVLLELGHQTMGSLRPDQYAEFKAKVEAL